ncbi:MULTISPECIES: universal stress protein [Halolamina]|uniref:Nucleotide-binding universal stress protein, UspA family n=1 Tax=Halolamina pelagica TaxID=699431 RepID=A0A1I5V6K7_9EURY|nr:MULTISPECIES: universal stress protein [Halolamina]NHX37905.1 universal stress protein [Halolamina sp. R1-12]SFQ02987.1 Nucleotide-binding universal stress protein, UspA family [Halolamina pelagica]
MTDRILVAYDGTPQAEDALEFAVEEWADHDLTLLYVINPVEAGYSAGVGIPSGGEEWFEQAKADAEELFADADEEYETEFRTETAVGRPPQAIVNVARGESDDVDAPGYDHLVIGSHGRTGVSRMLLGSVAEKVVRESPVPVTVVR